MPGASTAYFSMTADPRRRQMLRRPRRGRTSARNAVALLIRELLTLPPTQVVDVAAVAGGVPAHLVAGRHNLDVSLVHRLAHLCRTIQTSTGFDFRAWPSAYARSNGDHTAMLSAVLHPGT